MLRFLTAGESHGPGLVTIVEGMPAGLSVTSEGLASELSRRRLGYGRSKRMTVEQDQLEILGGVRHGRTLGTPIAVVVRNTEWVNWQEIMNPEPGTAGTRVTRPRPGHADLAGMIKYDTDDARDILERASARETAARTVAGHLAKGLLGEVGAEVFSHVIAIGGVRYEGPSPQARDLAAIDENPVRCHDEAVSEAMVALIDEATANSDTLGGMFEVLASGVPPGIGSHVHYDRRLDGLIGGALLSIPSVKGVEIGDGFQVAKGVGSIAHDAILSNPEGLARKSNRAGGLEGGMTNGETIRLTAAMKPLSTLMKPLRTVDLDTGESAQAVRERSDVCAVPAGAVVGEQMLAWVLAAEYLRKFGGDTVTDFSTAHDAYLARIRERLTW